MLRTFLSVLATFLIVAIMASVGVLWVLYRFGQDLPDYSQLADYEPPVVSRLYASDGRMFAEYAMEKRIFVPIKAMPKRIIRTFLAAEDKNFYTHPGVDALGIVRAALNNLMSQKATMGASTITQQVAKNFFLTSERFMSRKIKEAILAFRIENALSKDRILELYLNQIYLGQRSYGVAAAALNYFNKALDELSIEEAAYIAALPKAPNNYHPDRAPKAAKGRRDYVIHRMVEEGIISASEGKEAASRPIILRPRDEASVVQADFFAEEVRRELVSRYGPDSLYQGGLVVKTTLNPQYQKAADRALRHGLLDYDRRHGWRGPIHHVDPLVVASGDWLKALKEVPKPKGLGSWEMAIVKNVGKDRGDILTESGQLGNLVLETILWARRCLEGQRIGKEVKAVGDVLTVGDVILVERMGKTNQYELRQIPDVGGAIMVLDPHTGRVLAMSGGFSFAMSEFNRATQAIRQPGSAFKPYVYLAALESGRTPSTIIMDTPLTIDPGAGQPIWRPNNISKKFYGPVTLRTALEKSYNVSTIRIAQEIGMKRVADVAQRLGVIDHMPHQLSMVLGAGETTLKRMAAAYATFVNGGKKIVPTLIDRIQNRRGQAIYRHDKRQCHFCQNQQWGHTDMPVLPDERLQVINPIHAYQITSMLEGAIQRGTGRRLAGLKRPLAGKTGSTNDFRDAWFIGLAPDLVVATYIGFDDHRTLGPGEVGGRAALSVFSLFADDVIKHQPLVPFRVPSGVKLLRVNVKSGRPTSAKDPEAIWESFVPGTEPRFDEKIAPIGDGFPAQMDAATSTDQIY